MRAWRYITRSLLYRWRTSLTVLLGVIAGSAVLTGALIVGDSMRGSLRETAVGRLGLTDWALVTSRLFRQALADDLAHAVAQSYTEAQSHAATQSRAADSAETSASGDGARAETPRNPPVPTAAALPTRGLPPPVPVLMLSGSLTHAESRRRANGVAVLGIDGRFGRLDPRRRMPTQSAPARRGVLLNRSLADELGAAVGDDVIIHVGKPSLIPTRTLLGRRDDTTTTLRLTVETILDDAGLGALDLHPRQTVPRNAFVALPTLQRAIAQPDRVNALLEPLATQDRDGRIDGGTGIVIRADADVGGSTARGGDDPSGRALQAALKAALTLDDLELRLRPEPRFNYVAVESRRLLIEPALERACMRVAGLERIHTTGVLAYLANSIALDTNASRSPPAPAESVVPPGSTAPAESYAVPGSTGSEPDAASAERVIPYSTVVAVDEVAGAALGLTLSDGTPAPALGPGDIYVNAWTADNLGARTGDTIRLAFFVTGSFGRLETRAARFRLIGVLPMTGPAADPGFVPAYHGITDVRDLSDWDPPFPLDMKRIRRRDEDYWDRYRTAPKAIVSLADGQRLWTAADSTQGRLTAIRLYPAGGESLDDLAGRFRTALLRDIDPADFGFRFEPVRARAIEASRGATDFGGLFIGFSFFLIVSAMLLVGLLFRLAIERRSWEAGLLLAVGVAPRRMRRLLRTEGAVLACVGAVLGLPVAYGYAWLMLTGLTSLWSAAVHAPFLHLYATPASLIGGTIGGMCVAWMTTAWTLRALKARSVRALLAGRLGTGDDVSPPAPSGRVTGAAIGFCLIGILLAVASKPAGWIPQAPAFFGAGSCWLIGGLLAVTARLRGGPRTATGTGLVAALRLGVRQVARCRGRSVLTIALIASATFVVTALQAFRLGPGGQMSDHGGTGGFSLIAESAVPLQYDLRSRQGRDALGVTDATARMLDVSRVYPFHLRPGVQVSCLNLYTPTEPRLLGATDAFIDQDRFRFADTLAKTPRQRDHPWRLLKTPQPDGAIPVIADEASVLWQFHLGLGQDLVIRDQAGRPVTLRFVALLKGSILQGELIISEVDFARLFPAIEGYSVFLIDTRGPPAASEAGDGSDANSEARSASGGNVSPGPNGDVIASASAAPNGGSGVAPDRLSAALEHDLAPWGFDVTGAPERLAAYFAVQNTYLSTFQALGGFGLIVGTIGLGIVLVRNIFDRLGELALMRAIGFSRRFLRAMVLAEHVSLVLTGTAIGTVAALVAIGPQILHDPGSVAWWAIGYVLAGVVVIGIGTGAIAAAVMLRRPLIPALRRE